MKHWYAVFCKPNQDARAEAQLNNQGYEVFRPRIRTRKLRHGCYRHRVESMFPRYLFVRLAREGDAWSPIRSTRGVVGLVRFGDRTPTVPEPVVDGLMRSTGPEGFADLTMIREFSKGERVRIIDGPLSGCEALFEARSGEERVIVLLELMQRQQRFEIPARALQQG